jgi:asparagine synthase (glutamine-hydrolysing)
MCGIAGLLHGDGEPVETAALERMAEALAQRGPDGSGVFVRGNVGISHRRLAIIDPLGGAQPMRLGDLSITYNGEIYNHLELRRELSAAGHHFQTASDTETILHAYRAWGDACVERFRGMFAFAIVDLGRRRLFLARDHFGIKPLVYYRHGKTFAFASQIPALRTMQGGDWSIDLTAIDQFLQLQYIPAPKTAFRTVAKLMPGHRMSVTFAGEVSPPQPYWRCAWAPERGRSADEWIELIDHTVSESVQAHLLADVPYGAFLSGGVDSSAVVAHMSRLLDRPVNTFTIGFREADHDETRYAAEVAKLCGADNRAEIITADSLDLLPQFVRSCGEPFGDSSIIATWHVAKLARHEVPMVLSGDGGDELFAGYDSYAGWKRWLSGESSPLWRRALRRLASAVMPQRYLPRRPTGNAWLRHVEYHSRQQCLALWRPELRPEPALDELFNGNFLRAGAATPVQAAQFSDLNTYLPDDILSKVDTASMMHGLEVRTPLIDTKVIAMALTIPEELSLTRVHGAWSGKRLFKDALRRYLPSELVDRPKRGFAIPAAHWLSSGGTSAALVEERLLNNSALGTFMRPDAVAHMARTGKPSRIWLLLVLDEWMRQNMAGSAP